MEMEMEMEKSKMGLRQSMRIDVKNILV